MRAIEFTQKEKEFLSIVLEKRLNELHSYLKESSNLNSQNKFMRSYIEPLESVVKKYKDDIYNDYSKKEKLGIRSCINEYLGNVSDIIDLDNPLAWINISDEQKYLTEKIDCASDILAKCRVTFRPEYKLQYNEKFRYRGVFDTIDKMKGSKRIFLSSPNNVYKIAFVFQDREILTFELKNPILLYHVKFTPLIEPAEVWGIKYFKMITTKSEAKQLISSCNNEYYEPNVLEFMNIILN